MSGLKCESFILDCLLFQFVGLRNLSTSAKHRDI